jgi:N-acetylmuramoyl-L-alanine amidase
LKIDDVGTHHLVVGWKDCPRLWTHDPAKFDEFKILAKKYAEEAKA